MIVQLFGLGDALPVSAAGPIERTAQHLPENIGHVERPAHSTGKTAAYSMISY